MEFVSNTDRWCPLFSSSFVPGNVPHMLNRMEVGVSDPPHPNNWNMTSSSHNLGEWRTLRWLIITRTPRLMRRMRPWTFSLRRRQVSIQASIINWNKWEYFVSRGCNNRIVRYGNIPQGERFRSLHRIHRILLRSSEDGRRHGAVKEEFDSDIQGAR